MIEKAELATAKALTDEELENPGDVYILRGMAETELGNYDEAIESFTQAMEIGTETNKKNAEAWIDFIDDSTIWYHQTEYTGFTPFRKSENIDIGGGAFARTIDLHHIEPDIDRFSGDVLFISNDIAQPRTTASADDIKLVIQL